jgi:hypothetical protein
MLGGHCPPSQKLIKNGSVQAELGRKVSFPSGSLGTREKKFDFGKVLNKIFKKVIEDRKNRNT